MKRHRFHELDSLRAIAALGVICWHYVNAFGAAPFATLLAPFYGRGLLMVEFFFVLSGFVLAFAFWQDDRRTRFGANVMARIGRMYPLHIATLLAVACLQWWLVSRLHAAPFIYRFNDGYHFALNLFLAHSTGLERGFSFNAPSWSISTEFWVNVLFLGLVALPKNAGRWLVVPIAVLGVAHMSTNGVISNWRFAALSTTVACFFVGVALFQLYVRLPATPSAAWGWAWTGLGVACLALSAVYLSNARHYSVAGDVLLCCVVFPCLILAAIRSPLLRAALRVRPLVYLGEISYSIYLVHFPAQLALHCWSEWTGIAIPFESRAIFIGFIALVIALATATYHGIETPGRRLGRATSRQAQAA